MASLLEVGPRRLEVVPGRLPRVAVPSPAARRDDRQETQGQERRAAGGRRRRGGGGARSPGGDDAQSSSVRKSGAPAVSDTSNQIHIPPLPWPGTPQKTQ